MFHLIKKLRRREVLFGLACMLCVFWQCYFDLRLPDYMSNLTVLIKTPGSRPAEIWTNGLHMLRVTLTSAVLWISAAYFSARTASGFSYTVRERLFGHIMDIGEREMNAFSVPSLVNRTTNDITQVQMFLGMGIMLLVKAPTMATWAIIKILGRSWQLSIITAGFVIVLAAGALSIVRIVVPRFRLVQRLNDKINRTARENLTGINVVHAFNAEDYQNQKFAEANGELVKTQLFNQRMFALLNPMMMLGMNGLSLCIYWVGAALVNAVPAADKVLRITTFSNIVVFSSYAMHVVMSFMVLIMIFMMLPAAQVSAERINAVLNTRSEIREGSREQGSERGTLEFRNVSFRYPGTKHDQLSDISFKAERGETVAVIGATGSGKTTLVNLVVRFYDPTEGSVLIDGEDVRRYSFEALYNRIGFVTQRAVLFSGTIADNVRFGRCACERSDEDLLKALDMAEASEFVAQKEGGLLAEIAQAGKNVSGGQKQRLSIARALARKPDILVFDDSFSALDYKTDAKLRRNLKREASEVTKLVVAQRISTIRHADKIIVLDRGRMVGTGTHEELLRSCTVYREIAMSQLSPEELAEKGA